MKVKELIQELSKFDGELEVKIDCYDKDCGAPVEIEFINVEESYKTVILS